MRTGRGREKRNGEKSRARQSCPAKHGANAPTGCAAKENSPRRRLSGGVFYGTVRRRLTRFHRYILRCVFVGRFILLVAPSAAPTCHTRTRSLSSTGKSCTRIICVCLCVCELSHAYLSVYICVLHILLLLQFWVD